MEGELHHDTLVAMPECHELVPYRTRDKSNAIRFIPRLNIAILKLDHPQTQRAS